MSLRTTLLPAMSEASAAALIATPPPLIPRFEPRQVFEVSHSIPRSYFLGHHHAALSRMRRILSNIGLIIECRDFRVPLTSWNSLLESSLSVGSNGRQRIIVYTKRDLGPHANEGGNQIMNRLLNFHRRQGQIAAAATPNLPGLEDEQASTSSQQQQQQVLFVGQGLDASGQSSEKRLLKAVRAAAANHESMTGLRALVVGMPNAGKSTLLNKLRARGMGSAKAAQTGSQPGVTRKLSTPVRILPPSNDASLGEGATDPLQQGVFIMDTPGVFIPYVPDAESMLKLALVGCVKDGIIMNITIADYLLFHVNLRGMQGLYTPKYCPRPTNNVDEFLRGIALKTGKLMKGGEPNLERAADWIISEWRKGRFGKFVLDEIDDTTLKEAKRLSLNPPLSLNQARKREKELRAAKSLAKRA